MTFQPHMPSETELRELAIQIFFEENPEATTNPEEYELRAPEGHYYLEAQRRAMSSIREDLYKALKAYEEETENIIESLKELGEKPEGYATDEELQKQITKLDNKLAQTERKLEAANTNIEHLTAEKARLDELLSKERPEPPPPPEFGALRRREPTEKEKEPDVTEAEVIEPTEEAEPPGDHQKKPKKVKVKTEHKEPKSELKRMEKPTEPSAKRHKPFREIRPTRPLTRLEAANAAILKMYDTTVAVLQEGMKTGSTNTPLGIISFMAYIDLLHGGAYAVPINKRPFFLQDKTQSPYFAGDGLRNTDAPQGLGGWLGSLIGGLNAGPLVQEVLENANVPHIFPKLLSDEMYAILKAVFAWFTSTQLLQSAGTGVTTFVAAGVKAIEGVSKATESMGKAVQTAMPSAEQINALMPLLALLGV